MKIIQVFDKRPAKVPLVDKAAREIFAEFFKDQHPNREWDYEEPYV